ncbi:hypothetical protein [Vibrio harveyi]|uniref:hypothetical protein n=1 Tax=Vibrio harveyi TaxID=669 RepID=UPI0025B26D6D|nr:hypothetical protein [Vibrio harveyi]WJT09241.1 hypothetical protein PH545_24760 [Vibrio harveyi]
MPLNPEKIYHSNGQVSIPVHALTRNIPISAVGMYVFLAASIGEVAFDDEAMRELFYTHYNNSDDWKLDRQILIDNKMLIEPQDFEEETEEEAQERIAKLVEEINQLDVEQI